MNDNNKRQRRDNWQKIIDEYLQSGMTQKAFCKQRSLSLPKLVYYHGQFRKDKACTRKASFCTS